MVCELDLSDFTDILFVGSEAPPLNVRTLPPEFHSDGRPVSVCARYVQWLYGAGSKVDNVRRHVDLWTGGGKLYLYQSQDRVCQSVVVEDRSQIHTLFDIYDTFGTIVVLNFDMLEHLDDLLDNTQEVSVRSAELKPDTPAEIEACLQRHPTLTIKCECVQFSVQNYASVKHKNRVQITRAEFSDGDLSAARACLSRLSDDVRQIVNVRYG